MIAAVDSLDENVSGGDCDDVEQSSSKIDEHLDASNSYQFFWKISKERDSYNFLVPSFR